MHAGLLSAFFSTRILGYNGVNDNGERKNLVQHVSQTSILFTAVKVPKEENQKPRRIGFNKIDGDDGEILPEKEKS